MDGSFFQRKRTSGSRFFNKLPGKRRWELNRNEYELLIEINNNIDVNLFINETDSSIKRRIRSLIEEKLKG
jgi:hypothetical protein